jgi:hypothetical protein
MSAWKTYPHRSAWYSSTVRYVGGGRTRTRGSPSPAGGLMLGGSTHDGASTLIVAGPVPSLKAIERDTSPPGFPSRCTRPFGR